MIETQYSRWAMHPRRDWSKHRRRLTAVLAATLFLLTVAWRILTFNGFNNDHYIYVAGAQQMLLGEWPVRDFVDPGWPLMNALPAAVRWLFGDALIVEVLLVAVMFATAAAFTLVTATRLAGAVTLGVAVAVLEVVINPRTFGYPKLVIYAIAAWGFVAFCRHPTRARLWGLAFLTAVAFLFRHDHGLYVGIGALVAALLAVASRGVGPAVRHAASWGGAVALLLLPWAAFVQYHLGFGEYLRPALLFSRSEAEATLLRTLPLVESAGLSTPDGAAVPLFYLFGALPLVAAAAAIARWQRDRQRWSGECAAVLAIAAMAMAANLGFLRTPLVARVPDAAAPAMALLAWLLSWDSATTSTARAAHVGFAVVVLVLTGAATAVMASFESQLERAGLIGRPGAFVERMDNLDLRLRKARPEGDHLPSRASLALLPFYAFVDRCTTANDRLVMTGLSPDVFVLAGRGFAGGQVAFRPNFYRGDSDQRRAIARMERQSVPFVIVALEEEPELRTFMPLIAEHFDQHYEPMAHVPIPDQPGLRILVERGRTSSRRDSETGWPCFAD